jgi:hypothetical protein
VAELAGQPDEPVGHEPDPEGGDREGRGAARPSSPAAATPVTDMASVGAMTPTETDAVSMKRSSRRSAGRDAGSAECGWAMLS